MCLVSCASFCYNAHGQHSNALEQEYLIRGASAIAHTELIAILDMPHREKRFYEWYIYATLHIFSISQLCYFQQPRANVIRM
jgi:hypothetical protein